jgi:hypothetical protein
MIIILRLIIMVAGDRGGMAGIPGPGCVLNVKVLPTTLFPRLRPNGCHRSKQ